MISEINQTPKALRLHIGVFGSANAGKSTLINTVTGQDISITSHIAGTTTDPVFKPMELLPLGAVVFIDTAGLDDNTELGKIRTEKSYQQLDVCDLALFVISSQEKNISKQLEFIENIKLKNIPFIIIINEINGEKAVFEIPYKNIINVNLDEKKYASEKIKSEIINSLKDKAEQDPVITGNLVKKGDTVILVTPQDIQAPKGRLILPEVQTIRDLLDNQCIVITVTKENLEKALSIVNVKPALVVTDSQIFKDVDKIIPDDIPLTSFSVLMAKIKADIVKLIKSAEIIDTLEDGDRVAIVESCSHHAMEDDIARVKIPNLLRKYTGKNLVIENFSGQNINDISGFKLAVHCGGCMVSRNAMLVKQKMFEEKNIPLTNFGIAIAYMNGILERICY